MRKVFMAVLSFLLALSASAMSRKAGPTIPFATSAQNSNPAKKRGPVFRATKDQVKQAQAILKQRSFYTGEPTGKLDGDTRAGLKQYQKAESLKVTGTLNKVTLEKMNITLTDRQKTM